MRNRALLLWILCAMIAVPAVPRATVIVPAEFREIVNGSEIIAYGRVIETVVESSDDRRQIDTLVTLHVSTYLKGGPGDTIVFRVPGGQVGRYRSVLVGAPRFAVGDETVVFLNVRKSDLPFVFGLNQGVFRVRLDGTTKRRMVVPPVLQAQSDAPALVVRGAPARRPVGLETFGAQVQTVLAEAGANRGQR